MAFYTYDPDEVVLTLGAADIEGYAPDAMLTLDENTDTYSMVVGTTGDVCRSKGFDRSAILTIRLMQTSPSNDILSALHNSDFRAPNGAGVVTFSLRSSASGRFVFTAPDAWVAKPPAVTLDRGATVREWKIAIADLSARYDGGS